MLNKSHAVRAQLEKRLQDTKDRIEAEQVAKFEEQDMRMDEFRRSSETAQRTQERETRQALVQQKEESDDKFAGAQPTVLAIQTFLILCVWALGADMKKVMAAKNDEQDERNMREQSQLRTELQALRQDSERAQSDLKNKMEREDKALNNDLRDLTKQTREALEDDLHTLGPHHLCSPRQRPSSRILTPSCAQSCSSRPTLTSRPRTS